MARPRLSWSVVAVALGVMTHATVAQLTIERSASILVFPRVVAAGDTDTVIQITNAGGGMLFARCFYVNGALANPALPPGPTNAPLWQQTEFRIALMPKQPTHWVASRGRVNQDDPRCATSTVDCDGAGFDPSALVPAMTGFEGELVCVEVDAAGAPLGGDHLRGQATLRDRVNGVVKYDAVGIGGVPDQNNNDDVLCLGGGSSASCPTAAEYQACPEQWSLNHQSDGSEDPLLGAGSAVTTTLTVVPCRHDFLQQIPSSVLLQFLVTNELEQQFSASTTVTCWADRSLSSIDSVFTFSTLGTQFAKTRIRSANAPLPVASHGFIVLARTVRVGSGSPAVAATSGGNVYREGTQQAADTILLPPPVAPVVTRQP